MKRASQEADIIFAVTETMLLWDSLIETGMDSSVLIEDLCSKGILSRCQYLDNTPLCEYLREDSQYACFQCPWPGSSKHNNRCVTGKQKIDFDNPKETFKVLETMKL